MHLLSRDLLTNDFCGNNFLLFGAFSVIKVRELPQTRCNTSPFDALADAKLIVN